MLAGISHLNYLISGGSDLHFSLKFISCLQAFEHLLQRELISFEDNRGHGQSAEFRPVKLLISRPELYQGLKSYPSCPVSSF